MSDTEIQPIERSADSSVAGEDSRDSSGSAGFTALGRVSTEILCEIFRSTLPHKRQYHRVTHNTPPLADCTQCALGDALLWTTVEVSCLGLQLSECYPLAALKTQILRSKNAPLDVTFIIVGRSCAHNSSLLEVLIRESHRWERLDLGGTMDPEILLVLARIRGRLQLLKYLEIQWSPNVLGIRDIFGVAPQLQRVVLTQNHHDDEAEVLPILSVPWSQITHLHAWDFIGVSRVLCQTKILVECTLQNGVVLPGTPIVLLPRLRRLSVSDNKFLEFLETPSLEYLFIDFGWRLDNFDTENSVPYVPAFLRRSQCQLKGLTLYNCCLANLNPILRGHTNGSTTHFQDLPNIDGSLESIHFTFDVASCHSESLYNFIVGRRRTLKLLSIWADSRSPLSPDVKERLLALRSDDLDVLLDDATRWSGPLAKLTKDMEPMY
ncbi:hypothetical protein C8F04DRAFT_1117738 [Mycena alexandri]|uniref:Uncharacterized protein n=1 Tax=Mycena alexandri TaxID=1745969 RepID=A0AAD6SKF3_9AGAR|nr:hypothetical protein C8F04DRAFT_1117738 [Mycena alexandri]